MNAHVNLPTLQRSLPDLVEEYDAKLAGIDAAIARFNNAGVDLKMAVTIEGVHGNANIDTGHVHRDTLKSYLLRSAWQHVYAGFQIERLASPNEKQKWKWAIENPPDFTLDNIRGTFGHYLLDPRGAVLRALAEVFCSLDSYYKSHEKIKIGVKGLPKRVIIGYVQHYGGHGRDKIQAILNAIAVYQGKPLLSHRELSALLEDGNALIENRVLPKTRYEEEVHIIGRGVRLKRFANQNAHLFFEPDTLVDINKALSEFYGPALASAGDYPREKQGSTAVAKDLQFFGTPKTVVEDIISRIYKLEGKDVLEPSCGEGAIMDALRFHGARVIGCEYDPHRAAMCRVKGHKVIQTNFLQTVPEEKFDFVVMNPPFYGKHYELHVRHAFKFLKPGGSLYAILPVTARYDHGLLDDLGSNLTSHDRWNDLPVGSFSESGTNINTTVLHARKPE